MLSTVRLFVSKMNAEATRSEVGETTLETIDETINTVRRISQDLMPPALSRFGLAYVVQGLADQLSSSGKIKAECVVDDHWNRHSADAELSLFRIVQELINNSLKHAQASHIRIRFEQDEQLASIFYADDGPGIPSDLLDGFNPNGLGLRNIESRASQIGGSIKWNADPGSGMSLRLTLPTPEIATTKH